MTDVTTAPVAGSSPRSSEEVIPKYRVLSQVPVERDGGWMWEDKDFDRCGSCRGCPGWKVTPRRRRGRQLRFGTGFVTPWGPAPR